VLLFPTLKTVVYYLAFRVETSPATSEVGFRPTVPLLRNISPAGGMPPATLGQREELMVSLWRRLVQIHAF